MMRIFEGFRRGIILGSALALIVAVGCSIPDSATISPTTVPNMCNHIDKRAKEPINFTRLRQDKSPVYILEAEDTLGIFIEGILGKRDDPPPVHFPEESSDLPPAIGYPIPVREDGTISLPLVPPIYVAGLTIAEAEEKIRVAYTVDQKILVEGQDRILVTLMRPRKYQILVIREDTVEASRDPRRRNIGEQVIGSEQIGATKLVELRAGENDVLHALAETGGLPGLDAKNQIVILRGAFKDAVGSNAIISDYMENRQIRMQDGSAPNILRIPLRIMPGEETPIVDEEDIILYDGDIVFIESREAEVFYTGGLLIGGMHPLPRDFDLDVFGAISMSGGSIAAAAGGSGTQAGPSRGGVGSIFPPTRVIVIRQQEGGGQQAIKIDTKDALLDPSQRIIIQPNDLVLLEYTPMEVIMNIMLNNFEVRLDLQSLWD